MTKNEILPFGIADGANVLPTDEYQKLPARHNGFSAGVARSQELNKVWRQASMIAHVVAQFIAETNNNDVLDDGNADKLKAGLISALSKNVNNTIPAATKTVAGITKLSSATNNDDETQAATPKAVKAAYDLAKTVSIDELNKKLDKASVLQTTGNATDKVISQKACDDNYAKKNSLERFTAGQIDIRSNSNYASLSLIKGDGNKLLLENTPDDAYFVYRDAKEKNKAVVTIPSNKNGTLALTSDVDAIDNYPVGAPIPWPQSTPPKGYFVCDGNYFDKAKYPQLALAYPTGKLPILYGEFIRGLDLGRKVDPDRTVLSNQGDAMQKIWANWTMDDQAVTSNFPPQGAFYCDGAGSVNYDATSFDKKWNGYRGHFDSSRVTRTAEETRPRNVAFLYIVRSV